MFYGGCMVDFDDFRVEGSPLLIMMGEADDSMSIPACEKFRDRLQGTGVDVELIVYPGAGHAWDAPYEQQFFPGKIVTRDCLMHWGPNGEATELTSGNSMDNAVNAFRRCRSVPTATVIRWGVIRLQWRSPIWIF